MSRDKNFHLRNPQVQEIIGQVPPWLIRWGMTAALAVVAVIFCLSWFVRYPETVTSSVTIIATEDDAAIIDAVSKSEFIAEGLVDERYFHAVEPGQAAHIKLVSYPFHEYGVLRGTIEKKFGVQKNGKFKILILLPNGLATTHRRAIPHYENMTGTAEIVVQNPRLINRIFSSFFKILRKS